MVKRSEKLAFVKVNTDDGEKFMRMKEFTKLSASANPKEYTRRYIDEDMERSAVISYQPTISYKFDYNAESEVHAVFVNVSENELVGDDSLCTVAIVDLSRPEEDGYYAVCRDFNIIPDAEGDDAEAYTYSGSLKAAGTKQFKVAKSDDNWQTMTLL